MSLGAGTRIGSQPFYCDRDITGVIISQNAVWRPRKGNFRMDAGDRNILAMRACLHGTAHDLLVLRADGSQR